jgi:hypothetical protein
VRGGDVNIFLRNVDKDLPGYTASYPRIQCFIFRTDLIGMKAKGEMAL